ncbi:hypothetical protein TELCIR_17599 [Teladorsagia circumcincta]|uniref:VWFA domain-containing protein n=1 Tax=Teladorsagia circumcincta TaxID=45464 RepID=A0A2G9TSC5_TELCI|nr:hypothetical protein TELCIR_17599 [Teladorsagia circumcincta]
MSAYDVSQRNSRVAIVAVRSDAMGPEPIANFDTIESRQEMLRYINLTYSYTDFKHDGQAIEEAFTVAVLKNFMRNGYRTDIQNHVIVYVTATTKFQDDPRRIVDEILWKGSYGIITVGYGPHVTDQAALQVSIKHLSVFITVEKNALYPVLPCESLGHVH